MNQLCRVNLERLLCAEKSSGYPSFAVQTFFALSKLLGDLETEARPQHMEHSCVVRNSSKSTTSQFGCSRDALAKERMGVRTRPRIGEFAGVTELPIMTNVLGGFLLSVLNLRRLLNLHRILHDSVSFVQHSVVG